MDERGKKVSSVYKLALVFGRGKAYDGEKKPQDIVGAERNGNQ
jgi:hypothetical protein